MSKEPVGNIRTHN
jgi:hypothetical protein